MNSISQTPQPPPVPTDSPNVSVAKTLRWIGALALITSGMIYMIQGWGTLSSWERYLSFFSLVGLIGLSGILSGSVLKDQLGARTFLGLAAAAAPALFSQLGAMFYSIAEPNAAVVPQFLRFHAVNAMNVWLGTLATVVLMAPLTYVGFRALWPRRAMVLTGVHFFLNALILIPTREAGWTSLFVILQTLALATLARADEKRAGSSRARSRESVFVYLILSAPVFTVFVRGMFYPMTTVFAGTACLASGLLALVLAHEVRENVDARRLALNSGMFALALASMFFVRAGLDQLSELPRHWFLLQSIPSVFVLFALGMQVRKEGELARILAAMWAVMIVLGDALQIMSSTPSPWGGLLSAGLGAGVVVLSTVVRERTPFALGAVAGGLGALRLLRWAFVAYDIPVWICLAGAGIGLVLAATYFERRKGKVPSENQTDGPMRPWK
ncbi:MAG: hypothetical protein NDI61_01280 [Bdellovibrionaceae bacterium]|nr:hypothetical protein [Pseudobdellovibrionaceae bacterium]